MRSIEHEVLFETIRQSAFPLHAGCSRGLLRRSDRFREPAALRISCRKRPEKLGSLPPETTTACWAKSMALPPSRTRASDEVARIHPRLLRECGSCGSNATAI